MIRSMSLVPLAMDITLAEVSHSDIFCGEVQFDSSCMVSTALVENRSLGDVIVTY